MGINLSLITGLQTAAKTNNAQQANGQNDDEQIVKQIIQTQMELLRTVLSPGNNDKRIAELLDKLVTLEPNKHNLPQDVRQSYQKTIQSLTERMQNLEKSMINASRNGNQRQVSELNSQYSRSIRAQSFIQEFLNPPRIGNPPEAQNTVNQITQLQTQLLQEMAKPEKNYEKITQLRERLTRLNPERYNLPENRFVQYRTMQDQLTQSISDQEAETIVASRRGDTRRTIELMTQISRQRTLLNTINEFLNPPTTRLKPKEYASTRTAIDQTQEEITRTEGQFVEITSRNRNSLPIDEYGAICLRLVKLKNKLQLLQETINPPPKAPRAPQNLI